MSALDVHCDEHSLTVDLIDSRIISAPLAWSPRRRHAVPDARAHWELCAGGYDIHWADIGEDLSIEGLIRGAPAPKASA